MEACPRAAARSAASRTAAAGVSREALQHRRSAHVELSALDDRFDAVTRNRLEPVGLRHAQRLLLGALDDPLRNRVLGIAFDRRRDPKRVVRSQAPVRDHVDDPELTPCQGAGLVEHHGGEVARLLETASIADEQSRLRAETGGDGRHQRHGEPERVRAGDDEHGDQPFDRKCAGRSDREPHDKRERARDHGDDRQQERCAVSQGLGTRAGRLRLFNQPHDVGERGPFAGARHLHAEGAGAVDGTGDDRSRPRPLAPEPIRR